MQGILILNKPQGFTSQDAVSKTKGILHIKKAGHTGTLDPMATGVLPILLGDYTKLSKYLMDHDKTYVAKLKLGIKTDTGDLSGKVIENQDVDNSGLNIEKIKEVLKNFLGKQKQVPPMYSAVKINGMKLYEYAREGIDVKVDPRDIEIYKLNFISYDELNLEIEFEVSCSKGTYIRVLCEDIAKSLGTIGTMSSLNRTRVDNFFINNAIDFKMLEDNKENDEFFKENLVTIDKLFPNLKSIILNKRKEELFLNGVLLTFEEDDGLYNIYSYDNKYIGLGTVKRKLLKRDIIIN